MNARNAKTTFSFNIFLASLAGEPLVIKYKQMAEILGVSESTISKLRHNHLRKMPENLQPESMSPRFAARISGSFPPTEATAARFISYARMLDSKYIVSESLSAFITRFANTEPADEAHLKKFCFELAEELVIRCYEESYANTERDCANWQENHRNMQSEMVFQKLCNTINQDSLDDEKLNQLLTVVYQANLRRRYQYPFGDLSFLKKLSDYVGYHMNSPFYNFAQRTEVITISADSAVIRRKIKAREQIVSPSPERIRFMLKQTFYHSVHLSPQEIVNGAFGGLKCSINNIDLVRYINLHESNQLTSSEQFITAVKREDEISGLATTELLFAFNLYPEKPGEPLDISYEYCSTAPFIRNISCNYSYTLHYPCRFLEHEFLLDKKTGENWGIHVKLFTPITNSACVPDGKDNARSTGTADSQHITFYDWAMPGSGYYRNIFELKSNQQYAGGFD
ncbi:MAG TPA: hypothetical protein VHP54_00285 [Caproiciproducens sp.]|nr:hypothetical protein [Caproiciproducens sp.]